MIHFQIKAEKILELVKLAQAEIDKNPDGFINIEFKSVDKNKFVPAIYWTEEIGECLLSEEE